MNVEVCVRFSSRTCCGLRSEIPVLVPKEMYAHLGARVSKCAPPIHNIPLWPNQPKSHIQKVMFLAAVARPRHDTSRNREFSGKIGIFPFKRRVQAQRSSRNRPAGHMETKTVEVTKVYKRKMLEVFPAIKREWPGPPGAVLVRQDNAPAYRINNDPDIIAAGTADGWDIKFINHPANSPDTNNLDPGFFNYIQSLQDCTTLSTVDELVTEVRWIFDAQQPAVLGRVWTTYQAVLQEIMPAKGDNTFKIPHLHKRRSVVELQSGWPCPSAPRHGLRLRRLERAEPW